MRPAAMALALLLSAGAASAQRHKLGTVNTETPEGQLLQQIGTEADEAKRAGFLEQFAEKYPKHEAIGWVYEQMVVAYTKMGQPDKALAAGDKLLALDPTDAESAHACLKAAEAKKDPDLVVKWAVATSAAARKTAALPKPQDEDDAEEWKARVDFAKQVDVYAEYALSKLALESADPKAKIKAGEALEQLNPQSQYLAQTADQQFRAYIQTGDAAKAIALAERIVEKDQSSPEMILAVADSARAKKDSDKAIELAKKAIDVANAKAKPEGVSDADWNTWKAGVAGSANWIMGMAHAAAGRLQQTDQALRAALPGIAADQQRTSEALFQLGFVNYRMAEKGDLERARDAINFFEQCARHSGPYQAMARQNIKAIQAKYRVK